MKSTIITCALADLVRSPLNVRETKRDDPAIAQLAASILARGLISPIAVHALKKPKGKYGVLAGDRRWQAIQKLQADGAAFDFAAIPANQLDGTDAELTEVSLAENYIRQGMRPPEIYAAFRSIKERNPKITGAELAEHYGLDKARMTRILRLAYLHPTVFKAYAAGKLKDEEAFAYAATADQALQLQTFTALSKKQEYQRRPSDIRAAMRVGDSDHRRFLSFVTPAAYAEAGGGFEANLFADKDGEGRVLDEALLLRLVNEKLEATAAQLIEKHGDRGEITFVDEPPVGRSGYPDYNLRISHYGAAPLPEGPKLGILKVDRDGKAAVEWWWAKKPSSKGTGPAAPKPELTDKADRTLKRMRANMFGRHIFDSLEAATEDRARAHDALIYSLYWNGRSPPRYAYTGADERLGLVSEFGGASYVTYGIDEERFEPDLSDIPGVADDDPLRGFAAYTYRATTEQKDRLAAYIYYTKVKGELFAEGRRSIPEYLGAAMGDPRLARRSWTPSAAFFGLFNKDRILGWFGSIGEQFQKDRGKDKVGVLKENAVKFFVGDPDSMTWFSVKSLAAQQLIRDWTPSWLRWSATVYVEPVESAQGSREAVVAGLLETPPAVITFHDPTDPATDRVMFRHGDGTWHEHREGAEEIDDLPYDDFKELLAEAGEDDQILSWASLVEYDARAGGSAPAEDTSEAIREAAE